MSHPSCTLLWVLEADQHQHQDTLRLFNKHRNIDCHICHSHDQAIAKAEHLGPTVILQNMHSQTFAGLDLLRAYKQHPALAHIPIILLGKQESHMLREYAFFLGCNDYLENTPKFNELYRRILQHSQHYIQNLELESAQEKLLQVRKKLKQSLLKDSLTGLANRQAFHQIYDREWSRALRETEPLSIIIADIDHFKAYNDHYGHHQGDECIKKIAQLLTSILQRPTDFYARYSGAEFIILLPTTPAKGGIYIAETVRQALLNQAIPHAHGGHDDCITISLGLATTSPMLKHQARDLIRTADLARFEAKKQGRNCLVCKSL